MQRNTLASIFLRCIFVVLAQIYACSATYAQASTPVVYWELQILQNGRLVDSLKGATPLGQSHIATHRYSLTSKCAAKTQPAQSDELSRTITITPDYISSSAITFTLEAHETLAVPNTVFASQNCSTPAELRVINASYPAFAAKPGVWTTLQILKKPPLAYRLRARLANP